MRARLIRYGAESPKRKLISQRGAEGMLRRSNEVFAAAWRWRGLVLGVIWVCKVVSALRALPRFSKF
ncbi:hypothetical protein GCM10011400_17170 [Paraburkholderia caffeinilytica]|uniref:Transposase n=1 Tax=Paraburkholderia caffeinilytica TaxID=1761016 RepID=A0ABQ1LXX7_9BURK|nr:hypothetical protein GCM10011400_17170 [Paraburkholderia caffeinilytica]